MPLTNEQLRELHEAILSGFDQDGLTQLVRFDLGEVLGNLVSLDGGMNAIVFELIEKLEQRGTTDVLVQAACKARPGNVLISEYGRKYGGGAAARSSVAMAQQVGVVLKNVADAARPAEAQGKVEAVVRDFAEDMGGARAVTGVLKKYKVLHDQLHEIDHRLYGVIKRAAASYRGEADEKVALNQYTGELRDCAGTASTAARDLPLGQAELGWIGNIEQAVTLLAAGIVDGRAAGAPDGGEDSQRRDASLRRAVALLRTVIAREPSRINGQMMLLAVDA
jgi:hypothetical protein